MSKIQIKLLTDEALGYMYKNIGVVTKMIKENETNKWIYSTFPKPMFTEKTHSINEFTILNNNNKSSEISLKNHLSIFESLKGLPRYILTDERFWLWLYLEKYYNESKELMEINGESTISDHWMFSQGKRRGIFFGVLSRMYFRVELSEKDGDYSITKWIIENPERFRNLSWRTYSSEKELTYGILNGEKRACDELKKENTAIYKEIAKYISYLGSAKLLDAYSEQDIEDIVYNKCKEMLVKLED